jgi:hypothetical protein
VHAPIGRAPVKLHGRVPAASAAYSGSGRRACRGEAGSRADSAFQPRTA